MNTIQELYSTKTKDAQDTKQNKMLCFHDFGMEKETTKTEHTLFSQKYILQLWNLLPEEAKSVKIVIKKDLSNPSLWKLYRRVEFLTIATMYDQQY